MAAVTEINAREILDSRGNPIIEVDMPSGASTGEHEASSFETATEAGTWKRAFSERSVTSVTRQPPRRAPRHCPVKAGFPSPQPAFAESEISLSPKTTVAGRCDLAAESLSPQRTHRRRAGQEKAPLQPPDFLLIRPKARPASTIINGSSVPRQTPPRPAEARAQPPSPSVPGMPATLTVLPLKLATAFPAASTSADPLSGLS